MKYQQQQEQWITCDFCLQKVFPWEIVQDGNRRLRLCLKHAKLFKDHAKWRKK